MCKCTPGIKTPFCGKPGCEWPMKEVIDAPRNDAEELIKANRRIAVLEKALSEAIESIQYIGNMAADAAIKARTAHHASKVEEKKI